MFQHQPSSLLIWLWPTTGSPPTWLWKTGASRPDGLGSSSSKEGQPLRSMASPCPRDRNLASKGSPCPKDLNLASKASPCLCLNLASLCPTDLNLASLCPKGRGPPTSKDNSGLVSKCLASKASPCHNAHSLALASSRLRDRNPLTEGSL